MNRLITRPIFVFFALSGILALVFCLFPINLFDGVIEYVEPRRSYSINAPLSLSYFLGLGYDEADMVHVSTFYLTPKGMIMAAIFIFGFPALAAYRIHLKSVSKEGK